MYSGKELREQRFSELPSWENQENEEESNFIVEKILISVERDVDEKDMRTSL